MLTGPPIEVSRSYAALPPAPLTSKAATPGLLSKAATPDSLSKAATPGSLSKAATPGSSPPDPHPHHQLCPLGLDTMSGIDFQVAHEVPAAPPAAPIMAHVAPTPVSCEDSDTATAGQTAVPKPRHARFDSLVESQSSPQGVSLLDSLNPSAHVSMLPRHILDSIQLDDALGEEDHSPAGTGRPKRKGPPRIKSRRSRSSKQRLPASLHSPLLPDVVPAAARSSSGYQTRLSHSQSYSCDTAAATSTPLHRLKSGLAAGWQQLCKAGRSVMAAGQKLCKKLLSALGGMRAEKQEKAC